MPPMRPPIVLVTGSSDGIGKETAAALAERGARVILHGRDPERLAAAARDVDRRSGTWPAGQELADLSSLPGVRRFAAQIIDHHPRLDVLVNNAGVFMNERRLTADGNETTFAVNHLAGFLLSHLLLPALLEGPQGRIVNVSSGAHLSARLDWENLDGGRSYDGYAAYALSKLANVLTTVEMGRRLRGIATAGAGAGLPGRWVTVNALHPGVVGTKLLRTGFGGRGTDSLQESAATSVHLALAPELGSATGGYYARKSPTRMHPLANEKAITARFYQLSCRLTGVDPLPVFPSA
jgi:NAD(P)-dependent dehydrogenase (short-subunit alcohol dehydrogenase family)